MESLPGGSSLIYLILFVVFSSVFGLCVKWVHQRGTEDIISIGAINYICAAIFFMPVLLFSAPQTGEPMAILLGSGMGLSYFIAFFFVVYCVRVVGVTASTVVGSLALLMPILYAAVWYGEIPNPVQITGIALALMTLLLIGIKPQANLESGDGDVGAEPPRKIAKWTPSLLLFGFFMLCGVSRVTQEAFQFESVADQKPTFVLSAFVVAGIPSLLILVFRRRRIKKMEWMIGILMGVCNATQTFLILLALQHIKGYIVFPLSSAGGIVFTMLVATKLLGERLSKRAVWGIALAVVALVFLNWEMPAPAM